MTDLRLTSARSELRPVPAGDAASLPDDPELAARLLNATLPAEWARPDLLDVLPLGFAVDARTLGSLSVIRGSTGREQIYDGYPDVALEMIGSRTFDGRNQLVEYVPTILAGQPGYGRGVSGR